ncbi:large conductance mechanosensitive channel protein MscL [Actinotalea sp. M2MS4P-6]|uniref:large conductance mechanosensitive channel protein MscL n=1 Tax=Actinotalea sp. M2MS4P-6 TaxID=2983762 RepID=UPI0021E38A65|nr:large conductance mechanosensitive channel protein MscL [Actinotalea sp. M2MS4P-6]MCV2395776.1 large conductance mechanosensitive channel protein MscL [Actinotalea sp. M2MS4P-6]
MLKGFKDFIMRGNVVDLAVAVVIGAAFGAVVASVVDGFLNPLIAAVFGQPDLTNLWDITLREGTAPLQIGVVLNAALNFALIAAAVYFIVVLPMNTLAARRKKAEEAPVEPEAPAADIQLLTEIRDLLARDASA